MSAQTSRHSADSSASSRAASHRHASMGAKNSGRATARQPSGPEPASWNALTEMGRQQLAVATESASALYRGSEALRKVQQETAHEASLHHAQVAQKLFSPCQPSDMLALQTDLMRSNVQSATHYWQQMMVVALQTQRELMLSMGHLLEAEAGSGMKSAMGAFQSIIPPMANSFFIHNPGDFPEPH